MNDSRFVKVEFDLNCEWAGLPPTYRIYVNDELFAERTWIWEDSYLREMLQIQAPPGIYHIRIVPVPPHLATFQTSNHTVEVGAGHWVDSEHLEILP